MKEDILRNYLKGLDTSSLETILNLFTEDATVQSPLYGFMKASQFYKDLFNDTSSSKTTLKNMFISATNEHSAALQFEYIWTLKSGQKVAFEVIDVFDFDESNKIKHVSFIYDTHKIRQLVPH